MLIVEYGVMMNEVVMLVVSDELFTAFLELFVALAPIQRTTTVHS